MYPPDMDAEMAKVRHSLEELEEWGRVGGEAHQAVLLATYTTRVAVLERTCALQNKAIHDITEVLETIWNWAKAQGEED